jgi:hypothetical protein
MKKHHTIIGAISIGVVTLTSTNSASALAYSSSHKITDREWDNFENKMNSDSYYYFEILHWKLGKDHTLSFLASKFYGKCVSSLSTYWLRNNAPNNATMDNLKSYIRDNSLAKQTLNSIAVNCYIDANNLIDKTTTSHIEKQWNDFEKELRSHFFSVYIDYTLQNNHNINFDSATTASKFYGKCVSSLSTYWLRHYAPNNSTIYDLKKYIRSNKVAKQMLNSIVRNCYSDANKLLIEK